MYITFKFLSFETENVPYVILTQALQCMCLEDWMLKDLLDIYIYDLIRLLCGSSDNMSVEFLKSGIH